MGMNHSGNVQPGIDKEEHTHPFGEGVGPGAKSVIQYVPSGSLAQKFLDYGSRTDANPIYVGYNHTGQATSATNWIIQALTYDGSNRVTQIQVAIGAWSNRTNLTYS